MVLPTQELAAMMQEIDPERLGVIEAIERENLAPFIGGTATPELAAVIELKGDGTTPTSFVGIYTRRKDARGAGLCLHEDKGVIEFPGIVPYSSVTEEVPISEVKDGLPQHLAATNRTAKHRAMQLAADDAAREAPADNRFYVPNTTLPGSVNGGF